jgi:hypothetical protein
VREWVVELVRELRATGNMPRVDVEHVVRAEMAFPNARLSEADSRAELVAELRGMSEQVSNAKAWLEKAASRMEVRRMAARSGAGGGDPDKKRLGVPEDEGEEG